MTIYWNKSRQRWMYDFQVGGERHAGYCADEQGRPAANRTEAKAMETMAKAEARRRTILAPRTSDQMELSEALAGHLARHRGKPHRANVAAYVKELGEYFGWTLPVTSIDEPWIWRYVDWARQQPLMIYVGGPAKRDKLRPARAARAFQPASDGRRRTDATINRYLDCLRAALRLAATARDPVTGAPMLPAPPKVPKLKVPERLPRPIRDGNLERIIATAPRHLANAVVLTVLMGFRRGEVFGLTLQQVDPELRGVWLKAEQTKGGRDEFIPANGPALALLQQLVAEAESAGVDHLITYQQGRDGVPRPLKNPKTAWRRVMRDLGLEHRFHDTKASFLTALAEKVPGHLVQVLGRHKDPATTKRYIDVVDQAKRAAVDALADRPAVVALDMAQDLGSAGPRSPKQKSQTLPKARQRNKLSA